MWDFFIARQSLVGQGLLIVGALRHSDTLHWVGVLWTSDQPDAEISTWQHTTITTERRPYPRRDSNPQSQQASGRRPTSYSAWPPGSALAGYTNRMYIGISYEIVKLGLCCQSVFLTHLSNYQSVRMIFIFEFPCITSL